MEGPAAHTAYVEEFMRLQFPQGDVPIWAVEALATADIHITTTLSATTSTTATAADTTTSTGATATLSQTEEDNKVAKKAKLQP